VAVDVRRRRALKSRENGAAIAVEPLRGHAVRLGSLEGGAAFFLRAAHDASAQAFAARAAHLGVGAGEYASLTVIDANPGITQGRLGLATGRHMSTLTPILRRLEQEGLIVRNAVPADRRSFALSLTPLGVERLHEIALIASEHERELDRIIGSQRKAEFVRILRRIQTLLP
jgi:DNA-binding MarR family transcriptional regulator